MSWIINKTQEIKGKTIGKFEAYLPAKNKTVSNLDMIYPPYIKIKSDGSSAIVKIKILRGAESNEINISDSILTKTANKTAAEYKAVGAFRYNLYRMFYDIPQLIALVVAFLSVTGIIIDVSFKVGNTGHYLFTFSSGQYSIILVFGGILGVAAIVLLVIKGLKDAK